MSHSNTLIELLENERQLLQYGDLKALQDLAEAKSDFIQNLDLRTLSPEQLQRLQSLTARNQRLLAAAASGIRAAQKRIDGIRNPDQGIKTYSRTGQSKSISRNTASFEKRA
ncbi:flagellar biosynthesis protein FlgN [Aliiroseovarius sp. F20344]|uniref:flagellar biosynthesis protein FlgN n=1 Tax=Aliiroseovarius sp. F20344 TaxID=2926414 RepID=UPI001FF6C191|nr:flagellar biosynthesis protein FlgN [Aliiroseovarius sp. F20344]MCK0141208.1 flagellar biosynthesis protein FlgN [Aliiroseovarius sp. F20344]